MFSNLYYCYLTNSCFVVRPQWLECSRKTIVHFDCIWQSQPILIRENEYICYFHDTINQFTYRPIQDPIADKTQNKMIMAVSRPN